MPSEQEEHHAEGRVALPSYGYGPKRKDRTREDYIRLRCRDSVHITVTSCTQCPLEAVDKDGNPICGADLETIPYTRARDGRPTTCLLDVHVFIVRKMT